MYKLTSVNMTNVGLAMGYAHSFTNWIKYFNDPESAKEYAENDYTGPTEWEWISEDFGIRSPDLGHVKYHIQPVIVEDE